MLKKTFPTTTTTTANSVLYCTRKTTLFSSIFNCILNTGTHTINGTYQCTTLQYTTNDATNAIFALVLF